MDGNELIKALTSLTDEQKQAIVSLLTGNVEATKPETKKKRSKPKIVEELPPVPVPISKRKKSTRIEAKEPNIHDNIPGGLGTQAKVMGLQLGPRPNKFPQMPEYNSYKKDSEIDKKLWKNRKVSERGERDTGFVQSTCLKCGKKEEVHSIYTQKDEKTRGLVHICEQCIGR